MSLPSVQTLTLWEYNEFLLHCWQCGSFHLQNSVVLQLRRGYVVKARRLICSAFQALREQLPLSWSLLWFQNQPGVYIRSSGEIKIRLDVFFFYYGVLTFLSGMIRLDSDLLLGTNTVETLHFYNTYNKIKHIFTILSYSVLQEVKIVFFLSGKRSQELHAVKRVMHFGSRISLYCHNSFWSFSRIRFAFSLFLQCI